MHSSKMTYATIQNPLYTDRIPNSTRKVVSNHAMSPHTVLLQQVQKLLQQGVKVTNVSVNNPHQRSGVLQVPMRDIDVGKNTLKKRVSTMCKALNSMPGISCPCVDGAMYVFPRITLPPKAVITAENEGKDPDVFYCVEFLKNANIVVIPSFPSVQSDGTWHFQMAIHPTEGNFDDFFQQFKIFHTNFMAKYQDFGNSGYVDDLEYGHTNTLINAPVASKL